MNLAKWIITKIFWFIKTVKIRSYEKGLYFRDGEFQGLLNEGRHWFLDALGNVRVDVMSQRNVWLVHEDLDVIVKSGALEKDAVVLDLKDHERALVWVDGRFEQVVSAGQYALWTKFHDVKVEIVDARNARVERDDLHVILGSAYAKATAGGATGATHVLNSYEVEQGHVGVYFKDGEYVETLGAGRYAFWKDVAKVRLNTVDLRESVLDVTGQEIMTADKVTLRINAVVVYKVTDALKSVTVTNDVNQALYRETQLALRAVVGTTELDSFLGNKDEVADAMEKIVSARAVQFGMEVLSVGIRDIILHGEMKELMNKVTEAKKSAEASLITRREETAAMRSQANTAKLLENNQTLMRLKELEVLAKIAETSKLNVVLGEKGLADRVMNLL